MYYEAHGPLVYNQGFGSLINVLFILFAACRCQVAGIAFKVTGSVICQTPLTAMSALPAPPPRCPLLVSQQVKLKKLDDDNKEVKHESARMGPSPAKKLATDLEKKFKSLKGDTSLLKARFAQ